MSGRLCWACTRPTFGPDCPLCPECATAAEKQERPTLAQAAGELVAWFRDVPGALSASELLMAGCPNDLAGTVQRVRAALARERAAVPLPQLPLPL